MSWNLLIYKPRQTSENNEPLGNIDAVSEAFTSAFIGLEWESPTQAVWPVDGGFRLELTDKDGTVQDVYTEGGFNHVRQFAALCKREGWRLADAGFGEDVDLDDPQRWYEEPAIAVLPHGHQLQSRRPAGRVAEFGSFAASK